MATRYGRRAGNGTYEYHDSKQSLIESAQRERSDDRAYLLGVAGLLTGGVLGYVAMFATGIDFPKWLRFIIVIAGGFGFAFFLAKFADLIWAITRTAILLGIVYGVGALIWKVL